MVSTGNINSGQVNPNLRANNTDKQVSPPVREKVVPEKNAPVVLSPREELQVRNTNTSGSSEGEFALELEDDPPVKTNTALAGAIGALYSSSKNTPGISGILGGAMASSLIGRNQAPQSFHNFYNQVLSVFDKIDTDHNGNISDQDISRFLSKPGLSADEKSAAVFMLRNRSEDGLTKQAIQGIVNLPPFDKADYVNSFEQFKTDDFSQNLLSTFAKIDQNGDGAITKDEIKNKISDTNIKGNEAAALGMFYLIADEFEDISNDKMDGLSLRDIIIIDYDSTTVKADNNRELLLKDVFDNMSRKIKTVPRNEDGSLKAPTTKNDINPENMKQGHYGDCYMLAALYPLAHHKPEKVIDMIKENQNGTYTVKIDKQNITIKPPTDAELAIGVEGDAWAPLIEKAYGQYREAYTSDDFRTGRSGWNDDLTIRELTGNSSDQDNLDWSTWQSTTRDKLKNALDHGKVIIASPERFKIPYLYEGLDVATSHVYSVVGFNSDTDKVTIRNPWGETIFDSKLTEPHINGQARDGTNDGVFELTIEEFYDTFGFLTYEE